MNKTLRNLALVALVAAPFSAYAEIAGSGTQADPYKIASADDLGKAYLKVLREIVDPENTLQGEDVTAENAKTVIYFVQTADIDMKGVKNYYAINGTYGHYSKAIVYDGQNHVISNFAPDFYADGGQNGYYCTSIFGVATGHFKNLGVVNANVDTSTGSQATGVLGGYTGHGATADATYAATTTFENIYVTGSVKGAAKYTGVFCGTSAGNGTIVYKNCFANATFEATGGNAGVLLGRPNTPVEITESYVAGTVTEACSLVSGTGSGSVVADGLVVFNTGSTTVCATTSDVAATMANTATTKEDGIEEVKGWEAFSETVEVDGYPALASFEAGATAGIQGSGTEADPYLIATVEDLCNAYTLVNGVDGGTYYFKQTADIDMDGVEIYDPIAGWNGAYAGIIHYDGDNHVIKNFAPVEPATLTEGDPKTPYYSASIFGVPQGSIKNLGVINATSTMKNQGAGILGAYGGHNNAGLTVENVFVEGTVSGAGQYTGGMFGTTGGAGTITLTDCFVNVKIESGKAGQTAGIVGRLRNDLELTSVYVAGSVCEGAALVAATDKTPNVTVDAVIAFNTGATEALATGIKAVGSVDVATEEDKDELIAEVQSWDAFSSTKYYKGYPILVDFEELGEDAPTTGLFEAAVEEANAPAVYYNLQGVQVANPENGVYIVRRGNKVTKELIRK